MAKLKDGNCWMTTNLALNLADFAGDNPKSGYLTTENTDIGNDTTNPRTDLIDVPSTGGGNSGVRRWDPSFSSLQKAVGVACPSVTTTGKTTAQFLSECPSITTDSNGNYAGGNYFEIVSENYLGTKQHYQFQPSDVYGTVTENDQQVTYHWGTKCTAVGNCSNATVTPVDPLTELARSYSSKIIGYGNYYNPYAVFAETRSYSDNSGNSTDAKDSICPRGWMIPTTSDSADKSFGGLFAAYGYSNNTASEMAIRQSILKFVYAGYYINSGSLSNQGARSSVSSSSPATYSAGYSTNLWFYSGHIQPVAYSTNTTGISVRCVQRPGSDQSGA